NIIPRARDPRLVRVDTARRQRRHAHLARAAQRRGTGASPRFFTSAPRASRCAARKAFYHGREMSTMTNGRTAPPLDATAATTTTTRAWSVHEASELYE